ncbi:MAG TPA: hypothetical protein VF695_15655 [Sphingomonas sp.]|jgi:cytochrome c-type biogenesis protein CcmH/NrfG
MGWLLLLIVGAAVFAGLVALRVPRRLWSFIGAGLMLGGAGYALQGRPMQPASPAKPVTAAVAGDEDGLSELRERMWGRFTADGQYLVAADAMSRSGNAQAAVRVTLAGIRATPRSAQLWTGLGTVLTAHDGAVAPPARFAFDQARRLAPLHPAPPFFAGLAEARVGAFAAARPLWARALELTPAGAAYRPQIAGRLALLDRYLAEVEGR